jgi:hypothetical protein
VLVKIPTKERNIGGVAKRKFEGTNDSQVGSKASRADCFKFVGCGKAKCSIGAGRPNRQCSGSNFLGGHCHSWVSLLRQAKAANAQTKITTNK